MIPAKEIDGELWVKASDHHQAIKEALAQTEQEPVAWLLTDKNINSLQVDSIQRLISRLKYAHHTDLRVRINGQDEWFETDWLKHMVRVTPPQRTEQPPQPEQEPVAFWNFNSGFSHCMIDQLNEAAKKNPAPLYTTPPQRTWVGLTDEERQDIALEVPIDAVFITEAKLKEKNT